MQPLLSTRVQLAEFKRNVFRVRAEKTTGPEDLLNPVLWTNVADSLNVGDVLEVMPDGDGYFAELIVKKKTTGGVSMKLKSFTPLDDDEIPSSAEYETKWTGVKGKYAILRKADGKVVKDGIPNKGALAEEMTALTAKVAA